MKTKSALKALAAPGGNVKVLLYSGLLLFVGLYNFPLVWMMLSSLKSMKEIFQYPPSAFPADWLFSNYGTAWARANWSTYYLNTFIVSSTVPLIQILLSLFAGYAFTLPFRGSKTLFMLVLGTMMIPEETTLVAKYLLMKYLGWIDTYWALIVPSIAGAFAIFLFRQFLLTLPKDLEDAACIDGCSRFRYVVFIAFPLAKSVALTIGLLSFIEEWSRVLWPLIAINKDQLRVLQIALKFFADDSGVAWNLLLAACVFVSAPIVVLFFFIQKQFIDGVASIGIKG